jgi:hypothetical protein
MNEKKNDCMHINLHLKKGMGKLSGNNYICCYAEISFRYSINATA